MKVTAVELFLDASGRKRGRVCRRSDGRFQFVIETLKDPTEQCLPYWTSEYPASGIYERQADAASALAAKLQSPSRVEVEHVEFELNVGPYPDPTFSRRE